MHRNNMVGLIDEMEAAGWVRRHRSERDRRAFDIRLTRRGSAVVSRVEKLIASLDEDIGGGLGREQRRILIGLLTQLAGALELRPGVHPHLRASARRAKRPAA